MNKKLKYHPNYKPERNKEMYAMRKTGKTYREIAETYKVTEKRVRTIIKRAEEILNNLKGV